MALAETSIQLVPDLSLLVHLLLVVVMVVVLNLTLLKPINRVLAERERRTTGKLGDAAAITAEAKAKMRAWEQGLREARNEAYKLSERARSEALREREQSVAELKSELADVVATQKAELQAQQKTAQTALELEARRLAALIGAQILGRPMTTQ